MGLFSWLFGSCDSRNGGESINAESKVELIDITSGMEEEGFVDLQLALRSHTRSSDGGQAFVTSGRFNGNEVGFGFSLPADWKQGTLGDTGIITFQSTVMIESLGQASDSFLAALCLLYGMPNGSPIMMEKIQFTAISLEGDPRRPENGPVKIKLFFEPDENDPDFDENYAEHYLNLDFAAGRVEFHEKDPEYRSAIVNALKSKKNG